MSHDAQVYLEEYSDTEFNDFLEAFTEASEMGLAIDDPIHIMCAHNSLESDAYIVRAVRRSADGVHLGYCEVHDTSEPVWELGIHLLERHRGKGYGTAAMPLFLDLLAGEYDRHEFVAKVMRSNLASMRIFQALGNPQPSSPVSDPDVPGPWEARLLQESGADASPEALIVARQMDEEERTIQRESETFLIRWPQE